MLHRLGRVIRGVRRRVRPLSKEEAAVDFQRQWATIFPQHIDDVLAYWRQYRYFETIRGLVQPDGKEILDVGCGISSVLHFVQGQTYGIDPLADRYRRLYAYPSTFLIAAGAGEAIPFRSSSFDVVFCSNALDHTDDPVQTVREIARVLRPGGYLVVTVEVFDRWPQPPQRDARHPHAFRTGDIQRLLEGGFDILFAATSPWVGVRNYVEGKAGPRDALELVVVAASRVSHEGTI